MEPYTRNFETGNTNRFEVSNTTSAWNQGPVTTFQTFLAEGHFTSTLNGFKNPQWRKQIAEHENATTPCDGESFKIINEEPTFIFAANKTVPALDPFWGASNMTARGNPHDYEYLINPGPAADVITRVRNRSIAKFVEQANMAINSVESGQDIGEYKEAINSIIHPMGSLRTHIGSYFTSLRKAKAKYRKVPDLKKALTDTYLEWTFGVNPLVHDITDAYKGLITRKSRPITEPVEGKATESYSGTNGLYSSINVGLCQISLYRKRTLQYTERIKGEVFTGGDRGEVSVIQSLGLLPENWAPTAWDLLPYSWIVDYFTNLGDVIKSFSLLTSRVAWTCRTTRISVVDDLTVGQNDLSSFNNRETLANRTLGGHCKTIRSRWSRSPFAPAELVPNLQFTLPHSYKPWLNIGVLMASKAKNLTPFF